MLLERVFRLSTNVYLPSLAVDLVRLRSQHMRIRCVVCEKRSVQVQELFIFDTLAYYILYLAPCERRLYRELR